MIVKPNPLTMNIAVDERNQSSTYRTLHFSDLCIFYIEYTACTNVLWLRGSDADQP